jgi:hypothetical protein
MKRMNMNRYLIAVIFSIVGCTQLKSAPISTSASSTTTNPNSGATAPSTSGDLVAVGVGYSGRIVAGMIPAPLASGTGKVIYDSVIFTQAQTDAYVPGVNGGMPTCPAPSIPLFDGGGYNCCIGFAPNCMGNDTLYRGVAYGNGTFVAVGGSSTGIYSTSTDGIHWTTPVFTTRGSKTVYLNGVDSGYGFIQDIAYGNGVWVGVGQGGRAVVSTDLVQWTASSNASAATGHVSFIGDHFFATSEDGLSWGITTDGSTWTATGTTTFSIQAKVYRVGDIMYTVASGGGLYQASATDGNANWTKIDSSAVPSTNLPPAAGFSWIAFNPITQLFSILWGGGMYTATNPLGSWTLTNIIPPGGMEVAGGGYYVGQMSSGRLGYSTDQVHWTPFEYATPQTNTQALREIATGILP